MTMTTSNEDSMQYMFRPRHAHVEVYMLEWEGRRGGGGETEEKGTVG